MDAYIVAGLRSAVGKANRGGFRFTRPDDLAADVIKALTKRLEASGFDASRVDDLVVGNAVPEAEQGMQMGRIISLLSLPLNVPGMIVNRYCGSGLEAIAIASAKIHAGLADCIIAGGTESMSMVPMLGWRTALNYRISSETPDYYTSMGHTAEAVGEKYNVSRQDQDAFSFRSHQKAIAAQQNGFFKDEIVPITVKETFVDEKGKKKTREFVVDNDEGPRADTTPEILASLKPAFTNRGNVTAGNASQTSDGAAFVVVMSERLVKELNLKPIARMMSYAAMGVAPKYMGIGPVEAVPVALRKAGINQGDVGLVELNEAFAAQALAVVRQLDLDPDKVNVNGGAIALGHPLGCTGAKLSVQLFNEMRRRGEKYGIVTACVGGGQGVAGVYEFLN
ncbi:MAG: acetyl-CoA C-acyltransferase [Cytophagales bacterium]|nr:acetyl-CoA C-acyltransferase [Cytophagales bacterium]